MVLPLTPMTLVLLTRWSMASSRRLFGTWMTACKVSHVDEAVNEAFIERVRQEFEEIFEDGSGKMKVTRGKVHDFLGMTLDYNTDGLLLSLIHI